MTEIVTLTGLTMEQITAKMQEVLPDGAYKALPGAAGLTDINPAFLWEVLTACFGPAGYGWFYRKGSVVTELVNDGTKKSNWIRAMFDGFTLFYRLVIDGDIVIADGIESNGASENADFSYAVRGATTNALGGAARMLLWQLHIYKGRQKPSQSSTTIRNDGKPGEMVISFAPKEKPQLKNKTVAELWKLDPGWVEYLGREAREAPVKMACAAYAKMQVDSIGADQAPDLTPPTEWRDLWARAVSDLKFAHHQHAVNAYKGIFPNATKDNPPAIADAWAMLISHQREAGRLQDESPFDDEEPPY